MSQPTIILFLTKNEEKTVFSQIKSVQKILSDQKIENEVYISDDSSDKTRALALEAGAHVIEGGGQGLGFAFFQAIKHLKHKNFDCLIVMDCDGQSNLSDLLMFRDFVVSKNFDLVTASRFLNKNTEVKYKYPLINRIGVFFLSRYLRIMSGYPFTDSHGGIRGFSKKALSNMLIFGKWTYVQESIVDCKENNCKIIELSSDWFPRVHGKSRVVNSIPKYIIRVAPYLIFRMFRRLLK